jgi:hypothetical protein
MIKRVDRMANIIKFCAIITATPRWVIALLHADGLIIPDAWGWWWIIVSALLSVGMAVTEGLAFAYVFNAWRTQTDKTANRLFWFALVSGVVFVAVLAPSIAASVRDLPLNMILDTPLALWLWTVAVATSTIVIVTSVGYAEKRKVTSNLPVATSNLPVATSIACPYCGKLQKNLQALNVHKGRYCSKRPEVTV